MASLSAPLASAVSTKGAFRPDSPGRHLPVHQDSSAGLFRSVICGPGSTLTAAFRCLAHPPWRERVVRDGRFGLCQTLIPVPGEAPGNTWELLSIHDDVYVVITKCDYRRTRQETVPAESFLELHLTLDGETRLSADPAEIAVRQASMLVCRQSAGADYTVYCPPGPRCLVSIYVRPDFMIERMGVDPATLPGSAADLFTVPSAEMLVQQLPIRFDVQAALQQLLANSFDGARRLHFAAAKITELLCLCTRDLVTPPSAKTVAVAFTDRDLRMFEHARVILETQFNPQPTILSLARVVGTNTNKLKTGFKAIYGMTLFEFGHHHRMMHARHLLIERHLPVGEVARQIGYQSQASFSISFKEFFGQLPKDVRRTGIV